MKSYLLTQLGWLSIGTGLVGLFVPLLPSTCFFIAALWCFASGSPETISRIRGQRLIGPLVNKISPRFLPLKHRIRPRNLETRSHSSRKEAKNGPLGDVIVENILKDQA